MSDNEQSIHYFILLLRFAEGAARDGDFVTVKLFLDEINAQAEKLMLIKTDSVPKTAGGAQ